MRNYFLSIYWPDKYNKPAVVPGAAAVLAAEDVVPSAGPVTVVPTPDPAVVEMS